MSDEAPKVRQQWGGARPGAGRPRKVAYDAQKEYKRHKNKMPPEVRAQLGDNPSPIDLMQALMVWHIHNERWAEALQIANKLAPYVHAKVAPTDPNEGRVLPLRLESLTDRQLDQFIERLQAGIATGIIEGTVGARGKGPAEPDEPDEPNLH